ncbi:hypothetical protein [Spirosoma montaniterrae]|uniref:Uncharacterized protein n=1 Tax=Spirosoma montaniterrae TaxID=1178516 RepID=A0A1P9WV00_9BACT|nr:hypothetical protein [Spirosoma montaniterrae]AQG79160.1 hypothetical protein AWR27_07385 [Spirosoma montaniterrae]
MKTIVIILLVATLFTANTGFTPIANTKAETVQTGQNKDITFTLRNPSLLPKKITLVSYSPGEKGNGTYGFVMLPKGSKKVYYTVGTKLYLANSEQVDVVMSGKRLDAGKPFLIVKADDAGKSFDVKN